MNENAFLTCAESRQRFRAKFLGKEPSARVLLHFLDASSRAWSFTMYVHFSSKSASLQDVMSESADSAMAAAVTSVLSGEPSEVNMTVRHVEDEAWKERDFE